MKKYNVGLERKESLLESLWDEAMCNESQVVLNPAKNLIVVSNKDNELLAEIKLIRVVDEYDIVNEIFG